MGSIIPYINPTNQGIFRGSSAHLLICLAFRCPWSGHLRHSPPPRSWLKSQVLWLQEIRNSTKKNGVKLTSCSLCWWMLSPQIARKSTTIQERKRNGLILSMKSWLVNDGIFVMVYAIIPTSLGRISKNKTKQQNRDLFHMAQASLRRKHNKNPTAWGHDSETFSSRAYVQVSTTALTSQRGKAVRCWVQIASTNWGFQRIGKKRAASNDCDFETHTRLDVSFVSSKIYWRKQFW